MPNDCAISDIELLCFLQLKSYIMRLTCVVRRFTMNNNKTNKRNALVDQWCCSYTGLITKIFYAGLGISCLPAWVGLYFMGIVFISNQKLPGHLASYKNSHLYELDNSP